MEEEDKDGALKAEQKASAVHPPAAKPRPVPRKRNQPSVATTVQNGKPENIPPKPVLLPKPRRPPPNAPSTKPSEPKFGSVNNVINNNDVSSDTQPSVKGTSKTNISPGNLPVSGKVNKTVETRNGPTKVELTDSTEDEPLYEPLRPRGESQLSNSEEGHEDVPSPRPNKVTPPSPRKRSGATGDSRPPLPSKVGETGTKCKSSPPLPHKISSTSSKTSPPTPRKISGMGHKTSPQLPRKTSETRKTETIIPNTSPRTLDSSSSACNKPKPFPPKKPLPSLPKGSSGQTVTETSASKPPLPHKPAPELESSSKGDNSQPSVAALAQRLSTLPVFPFRDASTGKGGIFPSPGTSPRPSPHSSPRPTLRNPPNTSDKSDSKVMAGVAKTSDAARPKILPKPGASLEKPQTQGHETQKVPPGRPSPPSAKAVARVRSRTLESLEDKDNDASDDTTMSAETAERPKKRLATRMKTLQPGVNHPSSEAVLANRRPPPLPPGAVPVMDKSAVLKAPPLPPVPRPRPFSTCDHTQAGAVRPHVSKSVSTGDLHVPRNTTAEEQAQYSYAYEHTLLGASPPKRALSARNPPTTAVSETDGTYVTPDENTVNEFMEDLHEKRTAVSYDVADEQAVAGFMNSIKRQQTLNGMPCELSTDESESSDNDEHDYIEPPVEDFKNEDDDDDDSESHEYHEPPVEEGEDNEHDDHDDASSESSFSSDSSHEYCVPPENISPPEPPPHGTEYAELESIYAEAIHKPSEDPFSSGDEKEDEYEEPLYQVYTRCTLQRERSISSVSSDTSLKDEAFLEELAKGTLRNMRVLWCELPEVKASGILDVIKPEERKRQEAMFEVITSEASYLRSLNILISNFINSDELSSGSSLCVLERGQSHVLFSNIHSIKSVSENFLQALRARQKEAVVISSISDIIEQHATQFFDVYVKYCSNQIYQDRALKNLRKSVRFVEAVKKLQTRKEAQGLTLQSFLVLPMQRITRFPLLVNAICQRCEAGSDEFNKTDRALAAINKVVNNCNEGARKMERMEEICVIQTQIEFKTRPLALATPSRYLLRRGDILHVLEEAKSPLKILKPKFKPIYMFLFNDLLLLTKKKSDNRFHVLDYATRSMTQVEEPEGCDMNVDHMFSLVLLENSDGKTKEFLLAGNNETDKTRWMEAFKPPAAEQEGETVYASWDCPQVNSLHNYTAQQPDELSLYEGDVINVLKKLPDGWYHGERLCDGTQGWFPANHTEEIVNEHVRARNLRQRYRLLAASKHLIGGTLRL